MLLATVWSQTFQLPPNDERYLRLSVREAIEQILLRRTLLAKQAQAQEKAMADLLAARRHAAPDPFSPEHEADVRIADDAAAADIADTPRLTGDPEWDAIELAETDPDREPYPSDFVDRGKRG